MEEELCLVDSATTNTILRKLNISKLLLRVKEKSRLSQAAMPWCWFRTSHNNSFYGHIINNRGCTHVSWFNMYLIELQRYQMVFISKHIMTTKMNIYSSPKRMDVTSSCLRKFLHYQLDCISHTSNPYNLLHIR